MIELQTSVKQEDTTRIRTPKPGYLNLSITLSTINLSAYFLSGFFSDWLY
jgi:hypothetical protein